MTTPDDEVQRLRAQVAQLQTTRTGRAARAGRWVGAVVLLLVGLLLAVTSIAAVFARNQLLDTNRYVATVAPLARDPIVQDAIAGRLTTEIVTRVDLTGLAEQATAWLTTQGAPPGAHPPVDPAHRGVDSSVHTQVRRLVGTDQSAAAWDAANRVAHDDLVAVPTGGSSGAVSSSGTDITINLGVFLDTVKQRLVDAGFGLAARIPEVSVPFTVYSSPDLPTIRTYVRWLDRAATWLPWITLLVLAAAALVAPNRRRGLLAAGLFIAFGLLLARGGFAIGRDFYLDRLPAAVQSPDAVARILDTVTRRVRDAVTLLIASGFLIAAIAWLAGPGRIPVLLRRGVSGGLDLAAAGLGRVDLPLTRTHDLALRYRRTAELPRALRRPAPRETSPGVAPAGWPAAGVAVTVAAVEVLARLPQRHPTAA
ncbi:hypothetical protein K1W54_02970 [Micromonospora sp. CPCC 205371]|nr:hypothetical protein [Micromonospora sp. CPCC 205371]